MDRRKFLAAVGGIGAIELMTHEQRAEALEAALRKEVLGFLSTKEKPLAADHVGISLSPNATDASLTDVALRVQPDHTIAGRPVNVLLSFSVAL